MVTSTLCSHFLEIPKKKSDAFPLYLSFLLQSMIGHCLGAAGGLEAIATVKAITTGWLHPSINQFVSIEILSWSAGTKDLLSLDKYFKGSLLKNT